MQLSMRRPSCQKTKQTNKINTACLPFIPNGFFACHMEINFPSPRPSTKTFVFAQQENTSSVKNGPAFSGKKAFEVECC